MKNKEKVATWDGNEAAVYIAYRVNEVCAIYPITPSSAMAEWADEWSAKGIKNIWGQVPDIIEMQSEAGAAGTVHGALQTGALTTTFTASQGLLLMLPNMYKIAGELTSAVFHVAARSLATQALSIFGDHQDVMAARTTGFAMLSSASVQETHDMALIAQAATLQSRIPFIHFFDGFRTSHEINKFTVIPDEIIRQMIDDQLVFAHRRRALNPENPFIRGTAQNPDVYFQGRESANPFYLACAQVVAETMEKFAALTGRHYHPFDYSGTPDAEKIVVIMGSGGETAVETSRFLNEQGEKTGVIQVRLFRPFSIDHLLQVLPPSVKSIAVLDRTKEPGALGEPLYQDMMTGLVESFHAGKIAHLPHIIGGRYGLSSKEFTPAMVKGIFDELSKARPKNHFTIGITDDVTYTSIAYPADFALDETNWRQALFFGLGADGTVGANKNSIKIIGENTDLYAQGYFVYDSKKSGARTISHLRFGPQPIHAPYLVRQADFIGCHQYTFLEKTDMLSFAKPGATILINSPYPVDALWNHLPLPVQRIILDKKLRVFTIDAHQVAEDTGMGGRINTIMQTCFFAISGILPREEAIKFIKDAIAKTYFKKGKAVIEKNFIAVDETLAHLFEMQVPEKVNATRVFQPVISDKAPLFVREVIGKMMDNLGDDLPVSALPPDGTYPSGTSKWEKRNISDKVATWNPGLCIQCGNCSFVCPHAVIRAKFYHQDVLHAAPVGFQSAPINARGYPETKYTLQVYGEDCTGCNLCVETCPVVDPADPTKKAINLCAQDDHPENQRNEIAFFESIPFNDRATVNFSMVHGAQFLEPLFEFSGACAGCGETPYIKLLTQLFGDRLLVANATGCSSIYGGNHPTTPWTRNYAGQGPAWSNSLFEDNAEFGLGMRLSVDKHLASAREMLLQLELQLDAGLVNKLLHSSQRLESEIEAQRGRVAELKSRLVEIASPLAADLLSIADYLIHRSVWLVGGDGWAYDIGSGGLDHALASGRNINILVLDTEVYSNTGGQMSKATPTAATAKFAAAGKRVGKKDLAMQAIAHGSAYVAQIAMGANDVHTLKTILEAEAYPGPSLIIAYSHCIAHGYDMCHGLDQQKLAVNTGYWPLFRYNPIKEKGQRFTIDCKPPSVQLNEFLYHENRFATIKNDSPERADEFLVMANEHVKQRWDRIEALRAL